nr:MULTISPECIES: type II toxin-antitoxin system HicB family antitoxin [unclassified Coleofasciculus]
MTSDKLDLDPIQALTLEAFSQALAQLDSISALPAKLREEINQVGEALTNQQTDVVDCLEDIARKHKPLYDLFEAAYDALGEQYDTQERNKLAGSPPNSNISASIDSVDKILQILKAKKFVEEAKNLSQTQQAQTLKNESRQIQFGASNSPAISRTFTAVLYQEEDVYVAECPEVGTASQGETIEEALSNLKEATELYLEEFPIPETSPRLITTFEVKYQPQQESTLKTSSLNVIARQLDTLSSEELLKVRAIVNALIELKSLLPVREKQPSATSGTTGAKNRKSLVTAQSILERAKILSVEQNKTDESVEDLIELVDEWMNEDSPYDEEVYPQIDAALKQNRVSI